jgi:hypothetical protein
MVFIRSGRSRLLPGVRQEVGPFLPLSYQTVSYIDATTRL